MIWLGLNLLFCCLFGLIYFVLFFSFPAICGIIFGIHFFPFISSQLYISLLSGRSRVYIVIFNLSQSSFKSYTISAISKNLATIYLLPWAPPFLLCPILLLKIHFFYLLYTVIFKWNLKMRKPTSFMFTHICIFSVTKPNLVPLTHRTAKPIYWHWFVVKESLVLICRAPSKENSGLCSKTQTRDRWLSGNGFNLKATFGVRAAGCMTFFGLVGGEVTRWCFQNLNHQPPGSNHSGVCILVLSI